MDIGHKIKSFSSSNIIEFTNVRDQAKILINIMSSIPERNVLYITNNPHSQIKKVNTFAKFYEMDIKTNFINTYDIDPFEVSNDMGQVYERNIALFESITSSKQSLIAITPSALISKIPEFEIDKIIEISPNKTVGYQNFIDTLFEFGFNRSDSAFAIGDFSVNGEIVDVILPINDGKGVRVNFDYDKIVLMKEFDIFSHDSIGEIEDSVTIVPISDIPNTDASLTNFAVKFDKAQNPILYDRVIDGELPPGIERYYNYFHENLLSIPECFPSQKYNVVIDFSANVDIARIEKQILQSVDDLKIENDIYLIEDDKSNALESFNQTFILNPMSKDYDEQQ